MPSNNRPELTELSPETVRLEDLPRFPHMTGWFHPVLLGKLLLRVIISDVFGQYADRRLINAALDTVPNDDHRRRADLTKSVTYDDEGAIWIDYVSDLGDGFDATYAIAYLLAQPSLTIEGQPALPRGSVLIMGGDEVYPTAGRDDYKIKTRLPYSFALPDTKQQPHRPLLLLPGNHDWYDGLVNFLSIFCREKSTPVGDWRTHQQRSYFAAELSENWWVWGIDIALVRDMDQPQADYFVGIAERMPEGANIILCSAEPGWYKAESKGDAYRTLSYAAWIAENARTTEKKKKDLKIPLVLSGDSHHYARYSGPGAQYITSGGGGAFVHGTLELKDSITAEWLRDKTATLALESCYPTKEQSREMLDGNRQFSSLNPEMTIALGVLYLLGMFLLTSLPPVDTAILLYVTLSAGLWGYLRFQEEYSSTKIVLLAAAHAFAHLACIVILSGAVLWLNERLLAGYQWHWFPWLLILAGVALTLGRWLAGKIFGWNLLLTCRYFDINHNDAFSAMKLDSHRHFLRIRIKDDTLTIYPIKLDAVPTREQWRENPEYTKNTIASVFVADPPLAPRLIEEPIVIHAQRAPSTTDVKMPSELPPKK
jgi:hypothetical protein